MSVEYIRALIPPVHIASFEHDDWVSAVDVLSATSLSGKWSGGDAIADGQERILSGSYDGLLRVWNTSSEVLATSTLPNSGGRISAIKSAKFMSAKKIVSSGLDMAIRIWDYSEESATAATITPKLELYGHKWGVESIAVHSPSSRILSASADHTVGFWSSKASDAPSAPSTLLPNSTAASNKRVKLTKQSSTSIKQRGPLHLLSGHTAAVSSAIFAPEDPTVAYSVSHDHTLRTWDLPTGTLVDTRTTGHSLLSLASMNNAASGIALLAAGTSARHITLIDPRASATTVSALTLRGHTNAVVSLATDPSSPYGLVSGSHDGTCRIWDIRSTRTGSAEVGGGQVGESVYTIARESVKPGKKVVGGEGVKVFGVVWDEKVGIVSAGEDKKVQINRGNNLGAARTS